MSPLQFQKQLRLQEARRILLHESGDVGAAGRTVGYVSASQFSRELPKVLRGHRRCETSSNYRMLSISRT